MCSKPTIEQKAPEPQAVSVVAPSATTDNLQQSIGTKGKRKVKGKRSLMIQQSSGTGLNV